jgi:hypothetical protein
MSAIAEIAAAGNQQDATPAAIETKALEALKAGDWGLKFEHVKVTGYAIVRTYRLIQDGHWLPSGLDMMPPKQ